MGGDCEHRCVPPSPDSLRCEIEHVNNASWKSLVFLEQTHPTTAMGKLTPSDFGVVMKRMRAIRVKIPHHDMQRYGRDLRGSVRWPCRVSEPKKVQRKRSGKGGFNGEVCVT